MARGKTGLDSREYDHWLSTNRKENELKERQSQRRSANKGYSGWHFGHSEKPFHAKDKEEFKRELDKRGLAIKEETKEHIIRRNT